MMLHYVPILWEHGHDKFAPLLSNMDVCKVRDVLMAIDEKLLYRVAYVNQVQSICKHLSCLDFVDADTNYIAYVYLSSNDNGTPMRVAMVSSWCLDDIVHILDSRFYIDGGNARPYTIVGMWVKTIDDVSDSVVRYVQDYCEFVNSTVRLNADNGYLLRGRAPLAAIRRCLPKINTKLLCEHDSNLGLVIDELPKVFLKFPVKSTETDLTEIIDALSSKTVQDNAHIRVYYDDNGGTSSTKFEKLLSGEYKSILLTSESVLNHDVKDITPTVHISPTIKGAVTIVNNAGDDITVWSHWYMLPSVNIALLHSVI